MKKWATKRKLIFVLATVLILMDLFIPIGRVDPSRSCYISHLPRQNIITIWLSDSLNPSEKYTGLDKPGICNMLSDKIYVL